MLLELNSALGRKISSPLLHRGRKEGRKEGKAKEEKNLQQQTNKQTRLRST
jgi:hypothetical protein